MAGDPITTLPRPRRKLRLWTKSVIQQPHQDILLDLVIQRLGKPTPELFLFFGVVRSPLTTVVPPGTANRKILHAGKTNGSSFDHTTLTHAVAFSRMVLGNTRCWASRLLANQKQVISSSTTLT